MRTWIAIANHRLRKEKKKQFAFSKCHFDQVSHLIFKFSYGVQDEEKLTKIKNQTIEIPPKK